MEKLSDEQRAMVQEAWTRAKARMALQQIQEAGKQQRQEIERARMSGRTIDETGRDISERRQPEPEPIRTGWYWTGDKTVWVIGTTCTQQTVYYQHRCSTGGVLDWESATHVTHWQRVHKAVTESMRGFNWRPPAPND